MVASMAAVEEHNLAENDSLLSNKELAVNLRSDGEDEGADTETSEKEAYFSNPSLLKVEKNVIECTKLLSGLTQQSEEEKNRRRDYYREQVSDTLPEHGMQWKELVELLESMIVRDSESVQLKRLDENAEVAVLCQSISTYLSTLNVENLDQLSQQIFEDVTLWLTKLFRFTGGSASFHDHDYEGFVCVVKLALHERYPNYATNGFNALYTQPPVIYLSASCKQGLREYLCHQLGLPLSCVTIVPTCSCSSPSSMQKINISEFEKLVVEDESRGNIPVLLLAYAGTPWLGQMDNIGSLLDVCKKHNIWLHVRGNNLAALAKYMVPDSVLPAKSVNSFDLNLGLWLGLPAVPNITLFRATDPATSSMSGLATRRQKVKLLPLSLWVCLQNLGIEGVTQRINYALLLAKRVRDKVRCSSSLKEVTCANMANPKPLPSSSEQGFSIGGLISKIVNALMQYDEDNTVVVFRYVGSQHPQQEPSGVQTSGEKTEEESNPDGDDLNTNASDKAEQRVVYLDSLNTWLFESLSRDVPSLQLALVLEEIPTEGCTIRFAPAESANMFDVSNDDIDAFIKSLDFHLAILDVTLTQTDTFEQIVNSYDCLRSVHLPDWCGLGAIQYIPSNWIGKLDNLNESGHKDINNINSELVHQLKSSDGAFSLGTSVDQLACVRFGLITPDTKLEDLVQMVFATGRNIEESSKFVESMAEVVRQNIEKANIDLQKEAQEKAYQEGLLRKIPVVGSLMNWWSPSASDAVPRGRTFNLASGKIESTERVYKFHMQLQEADSNKSITQTPLKKKDSLSRGEPPIILPSSTSEAPLSPKSQSELEPKSEEQATKLQRSVSSSGES